MIVFKNGEMAYLLKTAITPIPFIQIFPKAPIFRGNLALYFEAKSGGQLHRASSRHPDLCPITTLKREMKRKDYSQKTFFAKIAYIGVKSCEKSIARIPEA